MIYLFTYRNTTEKLLFRSLICFVFFMTQRFIRNMQFSTSTFGLLQCHDIYTAIEIGLDCRSLDESHLI